MINVPVDQLIKKIGSTYKLVVLASKRAIEIGEGAAKLVDTPFNVKAGQTALEEIFAGKITYKIKEGKEGK